MKGKCCLGDALIIYFLRCVCGGTAATQHNTASSWAAWHLNWSEKVRVTGAPWIPAVTDTVCLLSLFVTLCPSACHSLIQSLHVNTQKLTRADFCLLHIKDVKICICCHGNWAGVLPASSEAIRDLESRGFRGFDRDGDQSGTEDTISPDCLPVPLLKEKLCVTVT